MLPNAGSDSSPNNRDSCRTADWPGVSRSFDFSREDGEAILSCELSAFLKTIWCGLDLDPTDQF